MLGRTNGANIYNFSNYVDELVSQSDIEKYLSPILDDNDRIKHIKGCLGQYSQYIQLFEKASPHRDRRSPPVISPTLFTPFLLVAHPCPC